VRGVENLPTCTTADTRQGSARAEQKKGEGESKVRSLVTHGHSLGRREKNCSDPCRFWPIDGQSRRSGGYDRMLLDRRDDRKGEGQ
jgi:hypothetical protein